MDKTLRGWQYAHHSIDAYTELLPSAVIALCRNLSFWNMYYLSNPYLDVDFDNAKALAPELYQINLRALGLLHQDYPHLPTLKEDLLLKPKEFQRRAYDLELWTFEREIGPGWWTTFDNRLNVLVQVDKPDVKVESNIIYVDFGNRRGN